MSFISYYYILLRATHWRNLKIRYKIMNTYLDISLSIFSGKQKHFSFNKLLSSELCKNCDYNEKDCVADKDSSGGLWCFWKNGTDNGSGNRVDRFWYRIINNVSLLIISFKIFYKLILIKRRNFLDIIISFMRWEVT